MWWDAFYSCSSGMEGYTHFREDQLGIQEWDIALYINDCLECTELCLGMDEKLTEFMGED